MNRKNLLSLLLLIVIPGCSPNRVADPFANLDMSKPLAREPLKDLTVVEIESENTKKAREYFTEIKTITFGVGGSGLFTGTEDMLRKNFRTLVKAKSLQDESASRADVVAILDVFASGKVLGVFSGKIEAKLYFLTPGKEQLALIEAHAEKRSVMASIAGLGGLAPTAAATGGHFINSLQEDALNALKVAFDSAAKPKLVKFADSRSAPPSGQAVAAAPKTVESDIDKPGYKVEPRAHDFAIVIGVEKYKGLPEAQYAEHDAAAVYAHIQALGYPEKNIKYLVGLDATKSGFEKTIETWLPRVVKPDSRVFFYFSGHGTPNPVTGQAYLVPWDGDAQYLEESAYPVKKLYDRLGALKAKSVFIALDSCFSGTGGRSVLGKGMRPLVNKVDMGALGQSEAAMAALTASAGDQISGAIDDQGHGLFTYYLLKGLNGAAAGADGQVTVQGLYDYLKPAVEEAANRDNRNQSPQVMRGGSTDAGGFILR